MNTPNTVGNAIDFLTEYQPELVVVEKDVIYTCISAIESGLEYARECLANHDASLGRTTLKNKSWAEQIESDISHMESTLIMLRKRNVSGAS